MYREARCVPSSSASSADATPSSSPVFGPVDSSPPSSPGLFSYSLDSPSRSTPPFSHPFAASTKAIKRLPSYEKKLDTLSCTPPATSTLRSLCLDHGAPASRSLQGADYSFDVGPSIHHASKYIDREECIWDDALRKPFDTGIGQIDLSHQQLKSIPASIGDLSGFFNTTESSEHSLFSARVFARVNTDPVRTRSFERVQSIRGSGKERHVLKLYLMGNLITSLPPELFTVRNLTVLSLRGNKLTFIPPEICLLTNLHELNISNNMLKFLPWQMRDMKIKKLLVNPNPFFPEPSQLPPIRDPSSYFSLRARRRSITQLDPLCRETLTNPLTKPVLSPVTLTLSRVPPFTELCLRILLAPSEVTPTHTVIADYYGFPISDQWTIPPNVRHTLTDALPGILRPKSRKRFSVDTITPEDQPSSRTGTGRCPNPKHKGRVFVKHASERFSWERRIAGEHVGGTVPLRWQGCLVTCLDFLDEEGGGVGGDESDVDMELAVQAVDLGQVSLDMED